MAFDCSFLLKITQLFYWYRPFLYHEKSRVQDNFHPSSSFPYSSLPTNRRLLSMVLSSQLARWSTSWARVAIKFLKILFEIFWFFFFWKLLSIAPIWFLQRRFWLLKIFKNFWKNFPWTPYPAAPLFKTWRFQLWRWRHFREFPLDRRPLSSVSLWVWCGRLSPSHPVINIKIYFIIQ